MARDPGTGVNPATAAYWGKSAPKAKAPLGDYPTLPVTTNPKTLLASLGGQQVQALPGGQQRVVTPAPSHNASGLGILDKLGYAVAGEPFSKTNVGRAFHGDVGGFKDTIAPPHGGAGQVNAGMGPFPIKADGLVESALGKLGKNVPGGLDTAANFKSVDDVMRQIGAHDLEGGVDRRPDLYMKHPKSGYMVRNEKPQTTVVNRPGEPVRVHDTVPPPHRMGNEVPVPGSERPPKYLFRAVSEHDYQQALKSGYLQSDGRMNLAPDEGTVAALSDPTWYLPGKLASDPHGEHPGRVLRIKYRDEDGWKLGTDGYAKTPHPIPMDRVDLAPQFVTTKGHVPSSVTGNPVEITSSRPTGEGLTPTPPVKPPAPPADTPPPPPEGPQGPGGLGTPEEVSAKMREAKSLRRDQEALYHDELAKRSAKVEDALKLGGQAAHDAARKAMMGELPKLWFGAFKDFDAAGIDAVKTHIAEHPTLKPFEKRRAMDAFDRVLNGVVPQRNEIALLERIFGKQVAKSIKESVPWHVLAKRLGVEIWDLPRALMASFDLSAPFRQGLMVGVSHPRMFFKNFAPMLKAAGSRDFYHAIHDDIINRPTYELMEKGGLHLTDIDGPLDSREEAWFGLNLAEKLTGGKKLSPVSASGRAYTGFLNKTRADLFDHLIAQGRKNGRDLEDEEWLKGVAKFVNSATGRGDMGEFLNNHAALLNHMFFSPRLFASRLNFLWPPYYVGLPKEARLEALKSAIGLAGMTSAVLTAINMSGVATVNHDPRNADFGKIKFGNTRIDVLGGFQQPIRLTSQLVSGKIVSSTSGKTLILGPQGPGKLSRADIVQRFAESKSAPTPALIWSLLKGRDFLGQPITAKGVAQSNFIPLLLQDVRDIYKQQGPVAAAGAGVIGGLGMGVMSYGPPKPKAKRGSSTGDPYLDDQNSGGGSPYWGGTSTGGGSSPYWGR